jgi:hypothetical protein
MASLFNGSLGGSSGDNGLGDFLGKSSLSSLMGGPQFNPFKLNGLDIQKMFPGYLDSGSSTNPKLYNLVSMFLQGA